MSNTEFYPLNARSIELAGGDRFQRSLLILDKTYSHTIRKRRWVFIYAIPLSLATAYAAFLHLVDLDTTRDHIMWYRLSLGLDILLIAFIMIIKGIIISWSRAFSVCQELGIESLVIFHCQRYIRVLFACLLAIIYGVIISVYSDYESFDRIRYLALSILVTVLLIDSIIFKHSLSIIRVFLFLSLLGYGISSFKRIRVAQPLLRTFFLVFSYVSVSLLIFVSSATRSHIFAGSTVPRDINDKTVEATLINNPPPAAYKVESLDEVRNRLPQKNQEEFPNFADQDNPFERTTARPRKGTLRSLKPSDASTIDGGVGSGRQESRLLIYNGSSEGFQPYDKLSTEQKSIVDREATLLAAGQIVGRVPRFTMNIVSSIGLLLLAIWKFDKPWQLCIVTTLALAPVSCNYFVQLLDELAMGFRSPYSRVRQNHPFFGSNRVVGDLFSDRITQAFQREYRDVFHDLVTKLEKGLNQTNFL